MDPIIKNHIYLPQQDQKVVLSEESADILQRLKTISAGRFSKPDSVLVNKLKVITAVELNNVLKCFFMEIVQEDHITDPVKFLNRLATLIPLEKMQDSVKDDIEDVLKEAKDMFEEAKLYLQMTNGNTSPSIQARISSILDGITSLIEGLITAFGIGNFFKPAENDSEAERKSHKIMALIHLCSMVTTIIIPILGGAKVGLIIGGIFLTIAALSIIWPWIKPKTTHLPANAENWTKEVQNGCFVAQGRKESLDEIAHIMKIHGHAILVGPSRVGKSLTAKAFVQAIENGEYPELKGKVVFRINTTEILSQKVSLQGGANNMLNKISTTMGRHRDDIILVLDEIHMACKNKEKIADQLKTFLDENGEFPHVIGITTQKEYDEHVKDNDAFSLRFDKVTIENTSRDETLKILADTVLRSHAKPLIKEDALDQIYDKSCEVKDAPQPATSIKLLKKCINRTGKTQKSPTEDKIIEVSNKILSLRSQAAVCRGRKKEKVQITLLEKNVMELKETQSKEQKELKKLFKSKDLLDRVTKETYASALKISTLTHKKLHAKNEQQLKTFLLLHEFLGRALESHIEETAKTLGIKVVIDKELIDEVAGT
jgi:ATP-dependent Clp protease ATP-binding subunit ClpA